MRLATLRASPKKWILTAINQSNLVSGKVPTSCEIFKLQGQKILYFSCFSYYSQMLYSVYEGLVISIYVNNEAIFRILWINLILIYFISWKLFTNECKDTITFLLWIHLRQFTVKGTWSGGLDKNTFLKLEWKDFS